MDDDEIRAAALHLAGHAVIAEACGVPYSPLALDVTSARCSFVAPTTSRGGGPARTATEAAIIMTMAGSQAEAMLGGGTARECADVARLLTDGDPTEVEPYLEWLRLKAARAIEHPLRQRLILALATALSEHRTLTAGDVDTLTRRVISHYMRGR